MQEPRFSLEVIGGPNLGDCFQLDVGSYTLGRSSSCDLTLTDAAISRQHAVVTCTKAGRVRLETYPSTNPIVVDGHACREIELGHGGKVLLGNTTLKVRSVEVESASVCKRSDAATVFDGEGIAAWHLKALHALVEVLDKVDDITDLEARMRVWCNENLATDVRINASINDASKEDDGAVRLTIPVPGDSVTLTFTRRASASGVPDSLRKTLVMAGRLFAFALTHARRLHAAIDDATTRAMSCGTMQTFLGTSDAARELSQLISQLAEKDVNVLLTGETGTGKSLVARLIHEQGPRRQEPFVLINCAAIPEPLIESELFGYERGAFTGAVTSRAGSLEGAGRGTVFLDEIGELPLASQTKLLHVLAERTFKQLGSNRTIRHEARVISATNRDLQAMIKAGTFREDLFYRLAIVRRRVPALRERGEDILLLAEHILSDLASSSGRRVEGFSQEALNVLARHSWPGNIRELRAAIGHALALGQGPTIEVSDLPSEIATAVGPTSSPTVTSKRAPIERHAIEAALAATGGNRTKAAELLGVSRQTLYNKLAEFASEAASNAPKKNDPR